MKLLAVYLLLFSNLVSANPLEVKLKQLKHGGPACPQGTKLEVTLEKNHLLKVQFKNHQLTLENKANRSFARSFCQFQGEITPPLGTRYRIKKIYGTYQTDMKPMPALKTRISFMGKALKKVETTTDLPSKDAKWGQEIKPLWSECHLPRPFTVKLDLRSIDKVKKTKPTGTLTLKTPIFIEVELEKCNKKSK